MRHGGYFERNLSIPSSNVVDCCSQQIEATTGSQLSPHNFGSPQLQGGNMLWIAFQSAKKSFRTSRITGSLSFQHRNSSGFHSLESMQSYSTSIYSIHFAAWILEMVKLSLHFLGAFAAVLLSTSLYPHRYSKRKNFPTARVWTLGDSRSSASYCEDPGIAAVAFNENKQQRSVLTRMELDSNGRHSPCPT